MKIYQIVNNDGVSNKCITQKQSIVPVFDQYKEKGQKYY